MSDAVPRALLIGATGLVEQAVARCGHALPLTLLARRPVEAGASHRAVTADPGEWAEIIAAERPGILISCLGTTIRQAGSQDAFSRGRS